MDAIDGEGARGAAGVAESPAASKLLAADALGKDGERAACEDAAEERVGGQPEPGNGHGKTFVNSASEQPRRSFHIPRKNKEKKALFQYLSPDSREFEDILKILSCSYLQSSSMGTFLYSKARLIHSELLVKDFVEKRKELKQNGRTESELLESYSFLLSDCYKLQDVCERGLLVGHSRNTTLGDPAKGVYLSRYSDLLQINPFDVGATGEIIIFKVLKGKVKTVNMSRNICDPTPNFDCHVSKNSYKVTSCLSYRAFELTQQYLYEYEFDEIRRRPRQVCPYAIVSFIYQGNTCLPPSKPPAILRVNSRGSEGSNGVRGYTLWSGQLLNQGRVVYQATIRSSTHLFLPFKLPEKLEIGTAMRLEDVRKMIPESVLSWEAYRDSGECSQDGLHCHLFVVEECSKQGSGFSSLLNMLENGRMVLVQPLIDRGFLFLLSSAQMTGSFEVGSEWAWSLRALFVFQESRGVKNLSSNPSTVLEALRCESRDPMPMLNTFLPALHYALLSLRSKPLTDLGPEVERQAREYLLGRFNRTHRRYWLSKYKHSYDERDTVCSRPKLKQNVHGCLHSYLYCPKAYQLAVDVAKEMVESLWCPRACSPKSDWESTDSKGECQQADGPQVENDPGKVEQLLKLIRMQRRNVVEDEEGRKRKADSEVVGLVKKYLRMDESGKGIGDVEGECSDSLLAAMISKGICDTDLRQQDSQSQPVAKTQTLLEMLLGTLQKALDPGQEGHESRSHGTCEGSGKELELAEVDAYSTIQELGLPDPCDVDLQNGDAAHDPDDAGILGNLEEEAGENVSSIDEFSPCSSSEVQPGPEQPEEGLVPWRLIPVTGIKRCKYSAREEHDPLDPRFTDFSSLPHDAAPGASDSAFSESEGHVDVEEAVSNDMDGCEDLKLEDRVPDKAPKDVDGGDPEGTEEVFDEAPEDLDGTFNQGPGGVDGIFSEEIHSFYAEIQDILRGENVQYSFKMGDSVPQHQQWQPATKFSEYITHYTHTVHIDDYISALRESMRHLIYPLSTHSGKATVSTPPFSSAHDTTHPSHSPTHPPVLPHGTALTSIQECPPQANQCHFTLSPGIERETYPGQTGSPHMSSPAAAASTSHALTGTAALALGAAPCSTSINSVISQMKPEFFSSLMEIIRDVQKNTVKFYVHSVEESSVCTEIKSYLTQLGNAECKPPDFLQRKNAQDKLLIIIQNKDIAAHIHTIPALLSLKELPAVSFAGVDSLEDVKNRTYNELFVSGGFIVSDEFVLSPDVISLHRLGCFLKFLEERCSADTNWCWKVHCKTQKKLKELGRVDRNALDLLNLLSTYQRRHVVEFLPYHECDVASHHAPDLECLVRLQAQHTRYRHTIFLTAERRIDLFPHHSENGIMIASFSDMMDCLPLLLDSNPPISSTDNEGNVMEGISLESEEVSSGTGSFTAPIPDEKTQLIPPLPNLEVPEVVPASNRMPVPKDAISQLKDSQFPNRLWQDLDNATSTPLCSSVDLYQNTLCPAAPWTAGAKAGSLTPTSPSSSNSSQLALAGLICSGDRPTGKNSTSWRFNTQEVKTRGGSGHPVPKSDFHSVTMTAVLPGGGGTQETGLPSATFETIRMHCSSRNFTVCNWGLQQDYGVRQQRCFDLYHDRFSSA